MNKNDTYLSEVKNRKLFDSKYENATIEDIAKDNLYIQNQQTAILLKMQKSISHILTIIIVLIILYVLGALLIYFFL